MFTPLSFCSSHFLCRTSNNKFTRSGINFVRTSKTLTEFDWLLFFIELHRFILVYFFSFFFPFRLSAGQIRRYYRLWIYTCNAVLLMAVIVFCGVAGKVLLADYRRLLINGLNLGQPSFIYAYLALLVQSGENKYIFTITNSSCKAMCERFLYPI